MRARAASFSSSASTSSPTAAASGTCRRAPASRRRRVTSAKLKVRGPTTLGIPSAAGSRTLWPPTSQRLPPTKATSAAAKKRSSSPRVSTTNTWVWREGSASTRRVARRIPSAAAASATGAKRSGWRGAQSSSASGWRLSRRAWISSTAPSSGGCVLAAIQTRRPLPQAWRQRRACASMPSGTVRSYLRLPVTTMRAGSAPMRASRVASALDCAATRVTARIASPASGCSGR